VGGDDVGGKEPRLERQMAAMHDPGLFTEIGEIGCVRLKSL
jgi:hypothetical protein